MRARITTHFNCTEEKIWENIVNPASLQFIAYPILTFHPLGSRALPDQWQIETTYQLRIRLFGLIPLGKHSIRLIEIDRQTNRIRSRESGQLAAVWNHDITFRNAGPGIVRYKDEIEIQSGWLTPLIWLFAHLFYRHRQRRWKLLLKMNSKTTDSAS